MPTRKLSCGIPLIFTVLLALGTAQAKEDWPESTPDGLNRLESKHVDAVYWRPGATLEQYQRVYLVECPVAFRKDWRKDFNKTRRELSHRVSEKDMERIKKELSEEFRKTFTEKLEEGGYELADAPAEDVLILRPAIINLDVVAPDLMTPDRSFVVVQSAGAMQLYMEMYDSVTSDKVGMVVDWQEDPDRGPPQRASSVSNRAAADRILRRWAELLVDALDEAHENGATPGS